MSALFEAFMNGPSTWPVKARRIFLLTFPISGLLWALGMAVLIVGAIAFCITCLLPFYAAKAGWDWARTMWSYP